MYTVTEYIRKRFFGNLYKTIKNTKRVLKKYRLLDHKMIVRRYDRVCCMRRKPTANIMRCKINNNYMCYRCETTLKSLLK